MAKKKNRKIWPDIVLIISALILGTLIVLLVWKSNHRTVIREEDETRVLTGNYPSPSELIEADRETYFPIMEIPDMVFARMEGVSFPEDCPVTRDELRYMKILYWGTDGTSHQGEMVVNEAIAEDVQTIFYNLYKACYPIESIRLVDDFGGNDEVSMANNNTSCFNGRKMTGDEDLWSKHAYGMAIDLNPLYNPYVAEDGEVILPLDGSAYVDRTKTFVMKLSEQDYGYQQFISRGFTWGGSWDTVKDYQHFEK